MSQQHTRWDSISNIRWQTHQRPHNGVQSFLQSSRWQPLKPIPILARARSLNYVKSANWTGYLCGPITYIFHKTVGVNSANAYVDVAIRFLVCCCLSATSEKTVILITTTLLFIGRLAEKFLTALTTASIQPQGHRHATHHCFVCCTFLNWSCIFYINFLVCDCTLLIFKAKGRARLDAAPPIGNLSVLIESTQHCKKKITWIMKHLCYIKLNQIDMVYWNRNTSSEKYSAKCGPLFALFGPIGFGCSANI